MNIELIATLAGYFVAIASAIGLITKLLILPHLERKIDEILKTRDGYMSKSQVEEVIEKKVNEKIDENTAEILNSIKETIEKQLRPNGGGSIVDRVPRIEAAVESISKSLSEDQVLSANRISNIEGVIGQMDSNIRIMMQAQIDSKK